MSCNVDDLSVTCFIQSLCTERMVMHTNYCFPGILQWYEVIRTEHVTLSPVCTANEAVKSACKELQKEIDKTKKDSSIDAIKSLSMKLNGMISASVQGGIPKYQEVRFEEFHHDSGLIATLFITTNERYCTHVLKTE